MSRPVKALNLADFDSSKAKYLQLADGVRLAIRKGQLLPGDALPSVKNLSQSLCFNRHTVMKALAELVAEGWVESKQRVGYRVVRHLPIESSQNISTSTQKNIPIDFRIVRQGSPQAGQSAMAFQYNFAGGQPDLSLFPFSEFKSHMSDVLSRPNLSQMGYGEGKGTDDLVDQASEYLRKVRGIIDKDIVVTNGSQEAMFVVAQLLLQHGDKVAVEALGYPPAWHAFKSAGASLIGIKQDEQGIVPQDLERNLALGDVRLIYLTPLHQYPTTVTLTVTRRMQIYKLAAKYKIPIIEDDYDHEFHYRCQPLAPMAADDPHQLIIYISSFSKIMFPGARIGLMAVNSSLAQKVVDYRMMICHKTNVLMQSALARWMKEGGFERHLRRTTRINLQRRDNAVEYLNKQNVFDFVVPDGGMAFWLKIKDHNVSAKYVMEKAKLSGIYLQDESQFHLQQKNNQDSYLRLGFAGLTEENFVGGVDKLITIIKQLESLNTK